MLLKPPPSLLPQLPPHMWQGFLATRLTSTQLITFALATFFYATWGIRKALTNHLFSSPTTSVRVMRLPAPCACLLVSHPQDTLASSPTSSVAAFPAFNTSSALPDLSVARTACHVFQCVEHVRHEGVRSNMPLLVSTQFVVSKFTKALQSKSEQTDKPQVPPKPLETANVVTQREFNTTNM